MKNKIKIIACALLLCLSAAIFSGCAELDALFNYGKEALVGMQFTVSEYDDFANKTLEFCGGNISVGLLENSANYSAEDSGFKSEVLEFTVDKKQVFQVGNTCLIAEKGIDLVTDFSIPADMIDANDGQTSFIPADRLVNSFRNSIGKAMTVVVASQNGTPIGIYQGNEVYVSVPSSLPKTTLITIDGKALYIHRARYTILETEMLS